MISYHRQRPLLSIHKNFEKYRLKRGFAKLLVYSLEHALSHGAAIEFANSHGKSRSYNPKELPLDRMISALKVSSGKERTTVFLHTVCSEDIQSEDGRQRLGARFG